MNNRFSHKDSVWFDSKFRLYYQTLCYFALNYLKDRVVVEDVVQGIFIGLLNREEQFENEEHLKYYLYKSVRNACLNEIKLSAIHSGILKKLETNPREEEIFFSQIVSSEIYLKIQNAINELPAGCGKIFRMAYLEQLDNGTIAEKLHISINTVKVQKNKAKNLLREKLKDLYPLVLLLFELH